MKVKELIAKLSEIEDSEKDVFIQDHQWDSLYTISTIVVGPNFVHIWQGREL